MSLGEVTAVEQAHKQLADFPFRHSELILLNKTQNKNEKRMKKGHKNVHVSLS